MTDTLLDTLVTQICQSNDDICAIRPSDPEKKSHYTAMLAEFEKLRGGKLWYPYLGSGRGKGALVELLDGSVKYDLISGIGVHWAHGHPTLIRAALEASMRNTVMQGHLQQDILALTLSRLLAQHSGFPHVFITTSGAMANENALKLAFHHTRKTRILAFERCFMGRTVTLANVTDKAAYREGLPTTIHVDYLPFYDATHPGLAAQKLREYLHRYPDQHAVLCMEPIQGEGGYYPAPASFFSELIQLAKAAGVLILMDEIQTFGRTEQLLASQTLGISDQVDILTVGKLLQVCATLFRPTLAPKPGLLSQTFTGAGVALATGISILNQLTTEDYLGTSGKIMRISNAFRKRLAELASRYPTALQGPFGYASMLAFTPGDGQMDTAKAQCQRLFDHGIIAFVAGGAPARIRFLLPMGGIEEHDLTPIFDAIERAIKPQK